MVFLFLFGVSLFSYFMGVFIEIVNESSYFNKELDDSDKLNAFFDTLKRKFNSNKSLNVKLINKIATYFEYKWANDPLAAISEENDI
jgi:hypothetical protein